MRALLCWCGLLMMGVAAQDGVPALPKGTRAVAFKVARDEVALVVPGSRVDILTSTKRANGDIQTKVLQEDVLVVAVDEAPADAKDRPTTVTVALTPESATRVSEAASRGTLRVILRPPAERR